MKTCKCGNNKSENDLDPDLCNKCLNEYTYKQLTFPPIKMEDGEKDIKPKSN